jgi:hypothetical protein
VVTLFSVSRGSRIAPSAVAVFAAVLATGCARERDVMGNPIDGSHRVNIFAVIDGRSEILWKLSAPGDGVRSAEHVEYGQIPAGFTQEIPAGAAKPRPMIPGEALIVVIATPEFVYRGKCEGAGPTEPRCESWESAPPEKNLIERALRGEKIGPPS